MDSEMSANSELTCPPPEVVEIILKRSDKFSILKSRLVCQKWNSLCLSLLEKSNFEQPLYSSDLCEYTQFVLEGAQFVLPFNFRMWQSSEKPAVDVTTLKQFAKDLETITSIFGPHAFKRFSVQNFKFECLEAAEEFLKLLAIISPGLKSIDLSGFQDKLSYLTSMIETRRKIVFLLANTELELPNVSEILCTEHHSTPLKLELCWALSQRSPNLNSLYIPRNSESMDWPWEKLTTLGLGIPNRPTEMLANIPKRMEISPMVLQSIRLDVYDRVDMTLFRQLLESFASTLKVFEIFYQRSKDRPNRFGFGNPLFSPFPNLPRLEALHFRHNYGFPLFRAGRNTWRLNPADLLNLKTLQLQLGFFIDLTDYAMAQSFQNIQNLFLHESLDTSHYDFPPCNWFGTNKFSLVKYYIEDLRGILSNVSKVCIVAHCQTNEVHSSKIKNLLSALLHYSKADLIKEIEIWDCNENYLGEILMDFEDYSYILMEDFRGYPLQNMDLNVPPTAYRTTPLNAIKMTNVERIILRQTDELLVRKLERSDCEGIKEECEPRELYLPYFVKYFPKLRVLEIASRMFGTDPDVRTMRIREIQESYPDWDLRLI